MEFIDTIEHIFIGIAVVFFAGFIWYDFFGPITNFFDKSFWVHTPTPAPAPNTQMSSSQVRATGKKVKATVVSIRETNDNILNYHPEVELTVNVELAESPAYQAKIVFIVNFVAIPQLQPGKELEVFVDPSNPDHVILVDDSLEY